MVKIIDGRGATLGRLASYSAKQTLKGEEIVIINCEQVIISGNSKNIKKEFIEKRGRVGSAQKGPKYSKLCDKIVKRTIRGMLPNYREGRGKQAYKKIKCYIGIPKEFEKMKKISGGKEKKEKFLQLRRVFDK